MHFETPPKTDPFIESTDVIDALLQSDEPHSCEMYRRWREQQEKIAATGDPCLYIRMEIESVELLMAAGYYDDARQACDEAVMQAHRMNRDDMLPEIEALRERLETF